MVGPVRGIDRYFGPSAVSREVEAFNGVPIATNIRNATFIGKGQSTLAVINESLARTASGSIDSLSQSNVTEITSSGQQVDINSFSQVVLPYKVTTTQGTSTFQTKISFSLGTTTLLDESYEFEVVTPGASGAGQYRVTTLSTGAVTTVQTANSSFGSTLIGGLVFRVSDTLGTLAGDKIRVDVTTGFQDGDFRLLEGANSSQLDWSVNSGSSEYNGEIGIPTLIDPTGAPTVAALTRNFTLPTISAAEVMPYKFSPIALDSAVYTATANSATTYQVVKVKDGVSSVVTALDAVAGTFTDVLTNATSYIFDGITLNMSVATPTIDGITFRTTASLLSETYNGLDAYGLQNIGLVVPNPGQNTSSETYKVRVVNSNTQGLGTYILTPQTSGVSSSELITTRSLSTTLLSGLVLNIPTTQLSSPSNVNLMLNSSFVDGALSNPLNWTLSTTASIDTAVADTPYAPRALRLEINGGSTTGATGNTFSFPEVTSPQAIVVSLSSIATATPTAGGLNGSITWYRIDGTLAGTTTITEEQGMTNAWSRITLTLGSGSIPVGAVKGALNLYNTDTAETIWVTSIQIEVSGGATAYRESDMFWIRTQAHSVPSRPTLLLETKEFAPSQTTIGSNLEISLLPQQSTINGDWYLRVTGTTSFEIVNRSTGERAVGATGTNYSGTLIPGVLLTVPNSYSATDLNDAIQISTLSKFNRTTTIPSTTYYASYSYERAASDYYVTKTFFDRNEVFNEFGLPNPANSLSLAAELYFQNGGNMLKLIQMDDTNDWNKAYLELEKIETNYILPLTTLNIINDGDGSGVPTQQQYLNTAQILRNGLTHCKLMSSILKKKERTIWGSNLRDRDIDGMIFDAQSLFSDRAVYIGPTKAVKDFTDTVTLDQLELDLDGCFIVAAALGARVAQADVAVPLTRKSLIGFKRLNSNIYNDDEKDLAGGNGVFLIEDTGVNFLIRHAVTTDPSNALKQEQTVRDIADFVAKSVRDTVDTLFIGKKFLGQVVGNVQQAAKEILEAYVNSEIINGYKELTVNKDPREPRAVNVRYKIQPVLGLNWILIEYTVTRD